MVDKSSPRELILAANEALENLHRLILSDESDVEPGGYSLSFVGRIMRLIEVYRDVILRVPLRKKGPSLIVQGFISELERVISLLSHDFTGEDGRLALVLGQKLATSILEWAKAKEGLPPDELENLNVLIFELLYYRH
ncbi:hypothetical protein L218DRAFT_851424 [Marasmius fiardii PR-910]|nr:hypothetical protein L218DRAFT_851424 [Marasmius fiardii PR-910]